MDCSMPGFPIHHQLLVFAQTHVHQVSDAIQLSFPSPPAFNPAQHKGLFKWVSSSHHMARVLEFQLKCQSFQWILGLISFRTDWLDFLAVQRILKNFTNTTVQNHQYSSVRLLSHVQLFATPWPTAQQASLSNTNSWSLSKPMSIESVMPSSHLILCWHLLLLPSIFPSIRVFSNKSALHMGWPKYWSFSFNVRPSNEHPGLISLGWTGWISLPSKGTCPTPQFKSIDFWCSAFIIVQLSHPYMTTRKTIVLTRRTFVSKLTPLLFNMLSRFAIAFLPRSKHL